MSNLIHTYTPLYGERCREQCHDSILQISHVGVPPHIDRPTKAKGKQKMNKQESKVDEANEVNRLSVIVS